MGDEPGCEEGRFAVVEVSESRKKEGRDPGFLGVEGFGIGVRVRGTDQGRKYDGADEGDYGKNDKREGAYAANRSKTIFRVVKGLGVCIAARQVNSGSSDLKVVVYNVPKVGLANPSWAVEEKGKPSCLVSYMYCGTNQLTIPIQAQN